MTELSKEFKGHAVPKENLDPILRIRKYLVEFYTQIKNIDKEAKIVKWTQKGNKNEFPEDNPEEIPTDAVLIAAYFADFNPRRKHGRVYIRIRIY